MMLQFNSIIIDILTLLSQSSYLQAFTLIKIYLRKPCSFDFVTFNIKMLHEIMEKGTK